MWLSKWAYIFCLQWGTSSSYFCLERGLNRVWKRVGVPGSWQHTHTLFDSKSPSTPPPPPPPPTRGRGWGSEPHPDDSRSSYFCLERGLNRVWKRAGFRAPGSTPIHFLIVSPQHPLPRPPPPTRRGVGVGEWTTSKWFSCLVIWMACLVLGPNNVSRWRAELHLNLQGENTARRLLQSA